MIRNHMAQGLLLVFVCLSVSCMKQQPMTQEQKVVALSNATDYRELLETDDKSLADHVKKMEESDDKSLDVEDTKSLENQNNKIIIAGDSWAVFPCMHDSLKKVIKQMKLSMKNDDRCLRTSKLGIEAREWIGSKQDMRLRKYLTNNKNIKYIYFSIGGNDLMALWTKDYTPQQELQLSNDIYRLTRQAIANYIALRPDIKIILSGYDYPHFKKNHKIWIYRNIYEHMGEPTDLRINQALVSYTQYMARIADYKNIFYVNHVGLSQYYDGVPEYLVPPFVTAQPTQISPFYNPGVTGGDVNYPSSKKSMIDWLWLIYDAFHLNEKNYDNVMMHTYTNVLINI